MNRHLASVLSLVPRSAPALLLAAMLAPPIPSAIAQAPANLTFVPLNQPGRAFSRAWDVNEFGQVALEAGTAVGNTRGFRWQSAQFTDIGTLSGSTIVRAISDSGRIVGNSAGPGGIFDQQAITWDPASGLAAIPRPPAPHSVNNFANDLNETGTIVGSSNTGWAWSPTLGYRLLPAINATTTSTALAINEAGLIVGSSASANGTRATLWRPNGDVVNLGTLSTITSTSSVAQGINDAGTIVGWSGDPLGFSRAFVWTQATGMVDLGAPGGRSSFANDINNAGLIVGFASFATAPLQRAYAWFDGQAIDLNTFLPAGSGWELNEALGVNDQGWIVGRGTFGGQTQAFLLVPAPSAAGLLLAAGLAAARRTRR